MDYDYWIAGITYYNFTVDFKYNNHEEYVGDKGSLYGKFSLNFTSIGDINERIHHFYETNGKINLDVEFTYNIVSSKCDIINNYGSFIFTYGYLTNNFNEIVLSLFNQSYRISVLNDTIAPEISYITPATIFDDNLTVEIICNDSDAVIFYTLDGSNPAYSPTRFIYDGSLVVNESSTLHYAVIDKMGNFEKYLTDTISLNYNIDLIRQEVYMELSSDLPIYYSFDGSDPAQYHGTNTINPDAYIGFYNRETTGSNLLYTHPFIVHDPIELRFAAQDRNHEYFVWFTSVSITCSNFDNSVNYIKNSSEYNSDAIWSQYQGDNHNTGVTNMIGPLSNHSSWSNFNIPSSGSAVVDGKGHIYIGGDDGYLYCLNNQGLVIWRYGTTSKIICTPTIGCDGNIYFSNWKDSNAYCISPNGTLIWKLILGDYNTGISPVFGLDNRIYIITSNNISSTIYVINNGVIESSHVIPCISGSTPAVTSDGTLYMSSLNHQLVVVNWDGSLRTTKMLGGYISDYDANYIVDNTQCSVSVGSDDTIYVLRGQNNYNNRFVLSSKVLTAFNPDTSVKWINYLNNYLVSGTPTYYKNVLYITCNLDRHEYLKVNGTEVRSSGGRLLAVNATNGELLWSKYIASSGSTLSSPLVNGDEIIYVASNNCVYAFNLSGEKIWEYAMTGKYGNPVSYSSPVLSNKGTLIVTTNQGIFAFNDIAADFTYNHVNGTASTIQFTDLSTNGTNRYYWTFGDGNFSRDQNPVHEYASGGKYRVVLLVEHNGIVLARNTTVEVIYYDIVPPSNVSAYINDTLTFGGNFSETQYISLNASDEYSGVVIYYTVDGSNPLNSSTQRIYSHPFDVEVDTVLTCVAVDTAGNIGNITQFTFKILDALVVNLTLADEIQKLLDEAEPYSKFVFSHELINGANFIINKPLNIISNNNTRLIGNGVQPVFILSDSAKGTIINGFIIENHGVDGVLIKNSENVTIRNSIVSSTDSTGINIVNSSNINIKDSCVFNSTDGIIVNQSSGTNLYQLNINGCYNNGVWIYQSRNTTLSNSLLESNGKDQYESKANQILVDDSRGTLISGNIINYGFFGIHLYHTNDDVVIENNLIYEGSGDAILLSNTYLNINIAHNLIDGSFNGIDFMGYSENVTIRENTIENLHEHEDDVYEVFLKTPFILEMMNYIYEVNVRDFDEYYNHRYNGIQVSNPASNFDEGNTIMIDNVVIKLSHRAWEARKYKHYLDAGCDGYGYNLLDGSASYTGQGGATRYREGKVDLVVDRIGDATFRLRLINRLDNHYLKNIPEFNVTFRAGGFLQTVKFINDSAIATFDVASVVSDIEVIISTEIRKSASFTMEITEGYSGSNRKVDPGFERGEAYDNPDPVIPKFPEPEDDYKPSNPVVNPPINYPQEPDEPTGYGNGTGNGQGNGTGQGTGTGDGNGSSGSFGNGTSNILTDIISDTPGMIGDSAENITDEIKSENVISNVEDSSEIGEATTTESSDDSEGMDRSSEGGSDAGNGETVNAYEVSKVINVDESNWQFVAAVILFAVIIILGYGYRRGKKDGDEF